MSTKSNEWRRANNGCLPCIHYNEILEIERRGRILMSVDCKLHGITNVKSMGCGDFKLYVPKNETDYTIIEIC